MINNDTLLKDALLELEPTGFVPYVFPEWMPGEVDKSLRGKTLGQLSIQYSRDFVSLIYFTLKMKDEGKLTRFPLYTEEEIKEDPTRETVFAFFLKNEKGSKVVIETPGGGYSHVCYDNEGLACGQTMYEKGFSVFILSYRIAPNATLPNPVDDLARLVETLVAREKEFEIDFKDYILCGYSASGHLAGFFCTKEKGYRHYGLPAPKVLSLGYPVVTFVGPTHEGTMNDGLGKDQSKERCEEWSLERHIDPEFPPTFLFVCQGDASVPPSNSRILHDALMENGIPCYYQEYAEGWHGWGQGYGTLSEGWMDQLIDFYRSF